MRLSIARRAAWLMASLCTVACSYSQHEERETVAVSISPATPAAWFDVTTVAVRLTPGEYAQFWEAEKRDGYGGFLQTKEVPAVFRDLDADRSYDVRLPQRFFYDVVPVQPRAGGQVAIDIPVLLRTAHPRHGDDAEPEKVLYVDTTVAPDALVLSWRQDGVKLNEWRMSRDLDQLAKRVATEHSVHGGHMSQADPRFDQAVLIVPPSALLADLMPLVEALGRVEREFMPFQSGATVRRPVFQVRVAHPDDVEIHAPESAPSRASTYEGPEPQVSLSAPKWMRSPSQQATLTKAIPAIVDCYKHSLTTNPELEKTFDVMLDIDVDGRVRRTRVPRDDHRDRVSHCSAAAFRSLRFEGVEHGHRLVFEVALTRLGVRP